MCVLDDTCATMHAVGEGADDKFLGKANGAVGGHDHFQTFKSVFFIFNLLPKQFLKIVFSL